MGKKGKFPAVEKLSIDPEVLEVYDPDTGEIRLEQEKAIPYVCDFVTEYINSDVLVCFLCDAR